MGGGAKIDPWSAIAVKEDPRLIDLGQDRQRIALVIATQLLAHGAEG
jgi:hypothetical protein